MSDVEFLRNLAVGLSTVHAVRVRDIAGRMEKLAGAAQKVASHWASGDDLEALTPCIEILECSLWEAGVDTR